MLVTVEHLGDMQFEVESRGHRILSDQPESLGGFDEGMTPPELMLASLGSCAGFYAAEYLKRHGLADRATRVRVTAAKAKNPARLDDFRLEVQTPVALSGEHRTGVKKAIERCLIHNTLLRPPKVEISLDEVHSENDPLATHSIADPFS